MPVQGCGPLLVGSVGDKLIKGIVWSYPASIPECPKIENLFSFYNSASSLRDGVQQDRPITPLS